MKYSPLIITLFIITACSQAPEKSRLLFAKSDQVSIAGTKWECEIAEGCVNVYIFKLDSSYKFYSCEMDDSLYGNYFFKQDTLILDEKGSIFDMPNDEHNIRRRKYHAIIKNGKLKHLKMYEWFSGKFELSNFRFDENYYYRQN